VGNSFFKSVGNRKTFFQIFRIMAPEIVGWGDAESAGDCAGVLLAMVDKWADARPMTHPLQS
jgi:hypothetical protein